jgi:hypothetical protein
MRSPPYTSGRRTSDLTESPTMSATIGDQAAPSHRAMRLALYPPAVRNLPPATRSPLGSAASVRTDPSVPDPSADHSPETLSQRATLCALTPPAVENEPPAIRSPLGRTTIAHTVPSMPVPSDDHSPDAGFQRAIELAPPNEPCPPTTTSALGRTTSVHTLPRSSSQRGYQAVPSQRANANGPSPCPPENRLLSTPSGWTASART